MDRKGINNISDEMLAAFLDGNVTAHECCDILDALSYDAGLRELLRVSSLVDKELGLSNDDCEILPMTAMAASCEDGAYCSLECEKYILRNFDVKFDEDRLIEDAVRNGWQTENGTALHNVGRHLEKNGLVVTRRYKASVEDLIEALEAGEMVIAAVDEGELTGDREKEMREDILVGQIPDHTVVVLSVSVLEQTIRIYDPNSLNAQDIYPMNIFCDAWNDSQNYLVTVVPEDMKTYDPKPIDLSDVELSEDLNELRESIAENAHDVWAAERKAQGWTYGPQRDDSRKETPCMVPYSQLPDSEKKFDREMAMNTLKLVRKLGYDIVKRKGRQ